MRQWARIVKRDVHAVYLAARDPRVPWHVRMLALCVAGYAVSPLDLIPDFIPVVGLLDDVIVVPLGIFLVIGLIPPDIMAGHRASAESAQGSTRKPRRVVRNRLHLARRHRRGGMVLLSPFCGLA